MAPIPPTTKLTSAILSSVSEGTYPDDDAVASAPLPSHAFPVLLSELERARDEVRAEIRQISKESAPTVGGWIEQAAALQADLDKSRAVARDIVAEAEAGRVLEETARDAEAKVDLLRREMKFNETLTATLESVKNVEAAVKWGRKELGSDNLEGGLRGLEGGEEELERLRHGGFGEARVVGLLGGQVESLRKEIELKAVGIWDSMLRVDVEQREVRLRRSIEGSPNTQLDSIIEALSNLSLLDAQIDRFARDFGALIVQPRLQLASDKTFAEIENSGPGVLKSRPGSDDREISSALDSVQTVIGFLESQLPAEIARTVFSKLAHSIVMRLTLGWLEPAMPMTVDQGIPDFDDIVSQVSQLADKLKSLGWEGPEELHGWIRRVPMTWLQRRRETSLAEVRVLCAQGTKQKHVVERVETEMLSKSDVMLASPEQETPAAKAKNDEVDDDWDADWGDGDDDKTEEESPAKPEATPQEDDDDAGAWGFDDDDAETAEKDEAKDEAKGEDIPAEDDEEDAWGWGDDDNEKPESPVAKQTPAANGQESKAEPSQQEITLRENYTVTSIPDTILEALSHLVDDAEKLADESYSSSQLSAASPGLYSIPTLLLAMYRATASAYYVHEPAGNMLIYNDTFRLTDSLQDYVTSLSTRPTQSAKRLRLDPDIKSLMAFGRRSYAKEMESQRTILRDLLDGAQGFSSVSTEPFASAADSAVHVTADRIRDVAREWTPVLSRSALLQSLGSLLSSVLNKLILDIEDLSDISEDESKALKRFCDVFDSLKDLFIQEQPGPDGETIQANMTGVYAPVWFKFQYLAEILESSLADIKFLWTESELNLEFEAEEVVELIRALFAESDHRRRAIAEIRRTAPGQS